MNLLPASGSVFHLAKDQEGQDHSPSGGGSRGGQPGTGSNPLGQAFSALLCPSCPLGVSLRLVRVRITTQVPRGDEERRGLGTVLGRHLMERHQHAQLDEGHS